MKFSFTEFIIGTIAGGLSAFFGVTLGLLQSGPPPTSSSSTGHYEFKAVEANSELGFYERLSLFTWAVVYHDGEDKITGMPKALGDDLTKWARDHAEEIQAIEKRYPEWWAIVREGEQGWGK